MELKHISDWPARATTTIKIPHYSDEQKEFLEAKGRGQGYTWLFMQIGSDYLLYDWAPAQELPDKTKTEMVELSTCFYEGRLDYEHFAADLEWYGKILKQRGSEI
jgi:hypothetical protein